MLNCGPARRSRSRESLMAHQAEGPPIRVGFSLMLSGTRTRHGGRGERTRWAMKRAVRPMSQEAFRPSPARERKRPCRIETQQGTPLQQLLENPDNRH